MNEHQLQASIIEWSAWMGVSKYPELKMLFAVPNGLFTTAASAGKAKAEGLKSGVPDLILPVPRGGHTGMALELKVGKNKPSDNQLWWLRNLHSYGWYTVVCWTYEDAVAAFEEYLDGKITRPRQALPTWKCPIHCELYARFGMHGQMQKLLEELYELRDEIEPLDSPGFAYVYPSEAALWEMADVLNVLKSIDVGLGGVLTAMAETKALRAQIRTRAGYYDEPLASEKIK